MGWSTRSFGYVAGRVPARWRNLFFVSFRRSSDASWRSHEHKVHQLVTLTSWTLEPDREILNEWRKLFRLPRS